MIKNIFVYLSCIACVSVAIAMNSQDTEPKMSQIANSDFESPSAHRGMHVLQAEPSCSPSPSPGE